MTGRLAGKVAIVTGGGTHGEGVGNGKAAALLFAREGAAVVVSDRDPEAAASTVDAITADGGEAVAVIGDLTRRDSAEALVDSTVQRYGRIDVLHNNIGVNGIGTVVTAGDEVWDRVLSVNLNTVVQVSRAAVPVMERGGGGSILTTSSISAVRPRGLTPYSAAKGAVIALTKAMAVDHGAAGIRVNCLVPGPVYSPHAAAQGEGMSEERRETRRLASPLQREGTPWDVAYAALYLASDEARWITGLIMMVDGGASLTSAPR